MKNILFACVLITVPIVTPGCGGDGGSSNTIGGPSCGVQPCGGDIVGTWAVTDICMNRSTLMMAFIQNVMDSCPGASLGDVDGGPAGNFVFNTDSTYSIDFTMTVSVGVNLPVSCFPGLTCADVDAEFRQQAASDPTVQSASCTGASTCACTLVEEPQQIAESGTYSLSGSTVLQTATGQATADALSYCVKDGVVTFRDPTPDPNNPVTAFVATKS
jgi:hypothetical protein